MFGNCLDNSVSRQNNATFAIHLLKSPAPWMPGQKTQLLCHDVPDAPHGHEDDAVRVEAEANKLHQLMLGV